MNDDLRATWKIIQEALDALEESERILDKDIKDTLSDPNAGIVNNDPIIVYGDVIDTGPTENTEDTIRAILEELEALFPEKSISYIIPDYDPDQPDLETEMIYNQLIERVKSK